MGRMTRGERDELRKNLNERKRVAKADIQLRKAKLIADFEKQIASIYPENDPRWVDITKAAQSAVHEADKELAAMCREVGIPAEFRPELSLNWWTRGENAVAGRRAELRKVAMTEIEARAKEAQLAIDKGVLHCLESLTVDALETDAARSFLANMPDVESLMPALSVDTLQIGKARDWPDRR